MTAEFDFDPSIVTISSNSGFYTGNIGASDYSNSTTTVFDMSGVSSTPITITQPLLFGTGGEVNKEKRKKGVGAPMGFLMYIK